MREHPDEQVCVLDRLEEVRLRHDIRGQLDARQIPAQ
jgi:hypothetical protein